MKPTRIRLNKRSQNQKVPSTSMKVKDGQNKPVVTEAAWRVSQGVAGDCLGVGLAKLPRGLQPLLT